MPNTVSVELYITRENIESILADSSVEQVAIKGTINIDTTQASDWNIEASGYTGMNMMAGFGGVPTCPQPCPKVN